MEWTVWSIVDFRSFGPVKLSIVNSFSCCRGDHKIGCDCVVVFFPLDESKQCQSDVQKIASEKAKLGEKVGKYNRLAVANDCVEMKEV